MAGIKKIKIPVLPEEVNIENIEPYLSEIISTFNKNKSKIKHFFRVFETQHEILTKKRRYDDDSEVNNIVQTPYLYEMVRFKTGYAFGNPKEYAQTVDGKLDELSYLNRYSKDSNERQIDKDVATNCYICGTSYYFIEPNKNNVDSEYESPYEIFSKRPDECFKVYSSYNGEKPLFDVLVSKLDVIENGFSRSKTIVSLYLPDMYYEYYSFGDTMQFEPIPEKTMPRLIYKDLPLVEKFANEERIGIIEIGESLQNAIDKLNSNQLDNVEDLVNELLIFSNTVLGKDQDEEANFLRNAKKNGVIVLNDANPDLKSDVKTLTQKLDYNGIITIIESLKRDLFDSCGVPIPSSDTSNGAKSGAVEKGNGYDNAYNRILDDYNSFESADRDVLKRKLRICKNLTNSKVKNLYSSDIEIKYNPNMTDNMLTKSQSYANFVEHGVPPVLAIKYCRISNDAISDAKQIEDYANRKEININSEQADNIQNG